MKLIETLKLRWIVWVWNHTPTCAEMARLASESLERRLPLKLRLRMRLHFLICVWCHRYARQLELLHQCSPKLDGRFGPFATRGLSLEARRRMVERLRELDGEIQKQQL